MPALNETSCTKGAPLRVLWTAEEARLVKRILNTFTVRQWANSWTEVDRTSHSGEWVIWIPQAGVASLSAGYKSFFKVYNASESGTVSVGVTDGGWIGAGSPTNCGTVVINGERVDVAVFTSAAIATAGVYWVWLHCWVDPAFGESAGIIVGTADEDDPPDNPHGGVAFSNQLLGRVLVEVDEGVYSIGPITQDYLRGGEHHEILFGDCEGSGGEE